MSTYWVRQALETHESDPTGDTLLQLLRRLTESVEELEREKADIPAEERGV